MRETRFNVNEKPRKLRGFVCEKTINKGFKPLLVDAC